jgi:hypothetical protein
MQSFAVSHAIDESLLHVPSGVPFGVASLQETQSRAVLQAVVPSVLHTPDAMPSVWFVSLHVTL